MNARKSATFFIFLALALLLVTACGGNQSAPATAAVPPTQAAAQQGGFVPAKTSCDELNAQLSASIGRQGSITASVPFEDYVNSGKGTACQIAFSATGKDMADFTGLSKPAEDTLTREHWTDMPDYGAGGAGGYQTAYNRGNVLCFMFVEAEPADPALCPSDQPIATCWETLKPEQKIFNLTLNCAQPSE
jgi:hypothetical protein